MPSQATPTEKVIDALSARGLTPKRSARGWTANCPVHEGQGKHSPSLSVAEGDNGCALLVCWAGCQLPDVVKALGLTFADIFPPKPPRENRLQDGRKYKAAYHYYDENGELLYRVVKYVYSDGRKTFRQQKPGPNDTWLHTISGVRRILYNLPQVLKAKSEDKAIWIVEGEKDAENLSWVGVAATCNPGGADNGEGNKFTQEMAACLYGARRIVVCADRDKPGYRHARHVVRLLLGHVGNIVVVEPTHGKDISDHLVAGRPLGELKRLFNSDGDASWLNAEEPKPDDDPQTGDLEVDHGGWWPIELDRVLSADFKVPRPEILLRTDGVGLFYKAAVNSLFGESGSGKTWLLMAALAERINLGETVVMVDFEDTAIGAVSRLRALGLADAQLRDHFLYLSPAVWAGADTLDTLDALLVDRGVSLAVIDSVGEALSLAGVQPNADEEVAAWHRVLPRRWARLGLSVVLLDHPPKDREAPDLFALGSQRKRAAIDGIALRVTTLTSFARGVSGMVKVTVAKDRQGTYPTGASIAEIRIDSNPDGTQVTVTVERPDGTNDAGKVERPTAKMERICDWLVGNGGSARNKQAVYAGLGGNRNAISKALTVLEQEGYIRLGASGTVHLAAEFHRSTDGWTRIDTRINTYPIPAEDPYHPYPPLEGDTDTGSEFTKGEMATSNDGLI